MFDLLEKNDLHPRVRQNFKGVKLAIQVIIGLLILAAFVPLVVIYDDFLKNPGFFILYLVLPMALAGIILLCLFKWWILPKFQRMSEIMNSNPPRTMILEGLGISFRGRERVQLYSAGSGEPLLVWVKTPNEGLLFKKNVPLEARVYLDPTRRDGFAVIDTGRQLVWGELLAMEES